MKGLLLTLSLATTLLLAAFSVQISGTPTLPDTPLNYANIALPAHLDTLGIDSSPTNNPITDAGATLGRVLFYDTRLSETQEISCASCHRPEFGFSDPDSVSTGVHGRLGARNSMGLANIRFYATGEGNWDHAAPTLELQAKGAMQGFVEMNLNTRDAVPRLRQTTFYAELFGDAFNVPATESAITESRMLDAIGQFVRSVVSHRTRFDEGLALTPDPDSPFSNFTAQENRGKELFFGQALCGQCHAQNMAFVSDQPRNNGLDIVSTDVGLFGQTAAPADSGKFKPASLRSIALTAPYMHDARFATIEDVVEHYDSGIQPHPNLDPILKDANGNPVRLNLSAGDRAALVAFLRTLTDNALAVDERWNDPFVTAPPPPLTVGVTPTLTTIPASGGPTNFSVNLVNTGPNSVTFEMRTLVLLPNGNQLVRSPKTFTFAPGQSVTAPRTEVAPASAPAGTYTVWVEAHGISETFVARSDSFLVTKEPPTQAASRAGLPTELALHAAFPNPFNGATTLNVDVPEPTDVRVEVLDLLGRRVAMLADEPMEPGTHALRWDAAGLANGTYLVHMRAGADFTATQRVTLTR